MILKQDRYTAAIYCRLSTDDGQEGESCSIHTQRTLLKQFCEDNRFSIHDYYVDDGYSGKSFERPDFQRMLRDIEAGKVNLVITKDLSRFGRDYIDVGYYLEKYFPSLNVRYIAVSDSVDTLTDSSDNIFMPLMNVVNDMAARDASRKTRNAFNTKTRSGEYMASAAPYGYKKDPERHNRLVIDEEAAAAVRMIYDLAAANQGYNSITKQMREAGFLCPSDYKAQQTGKPARNKGRGWHQDTVRYILKNQVYAGHTVAGKRRVAVMSTTKKRAMPPEEWIIVRDTHEPIIPQEQWDRVQELLQRRSRPKSNGEPHIFAGLLYCADCGSALNYHGRGGKGRHVKNGDFTCWIYKQYGAAQCTSHYISYDELYRLILQDIRYHAELIFYYPQRFRSRLLAQGRKEQARQNRALNKEAERLRQRLPELDRIISQLYEDKALGKLPLTRFEKLAAQYETEQQQAQARLDEIEATLKQAWSREQDIDRFIEGMSKYCGVEQLDAALLNELIDRIEVGQKQTHLDGIKTQAIHIHYRFAGIIEEEEGEGEDAPAPL